MNACRSCALAVVAGSLMLAGCDEQASQQFAAGRNLDEAVRLMEQAHLGFVPGEEDEQVARDVEAYRQATLDQAIEPLEDVIDRGTTAQAVQAAVLRSDIASSHAMHLTSQAVDASNELLRDTTTLFQTASDLVTNRAALQMLDRDLGQVASRYSSARADREDEIAELRRQQEQMEGELEDLRERSQRARDTARRLMERAAEAKEQAFMAEGEKRYELEDAAAEHRRNAAAQTAKAEELEVRAGVLESRLALVNRRIDALTRASETLRERAQVTDRQQGDLRSQQEDTRRAINELIEEVRADATGLQSRFERDISTPLSDAADALAAAIDTLDKVAQREGITDQQEARLRLTLFARRLDLAHVLSQHAGITRSFASALDHASESSERIDFGTMVGDLEALHARLVEATQSVALAARELAGDIDRTNALGEIVEDADARAEMQASLERRRRAIDSYVTHATFSGS